MLIFLAHLFVPAERSGILISGLFGIVTFLLINGISRLLEGGEAQLNKTAKNTGLIGFIYLELIDASFSLDVVLGAFALSNDIIIITIGLAIGAMFVRSLTVMIVEKKTLNKDRKSTRLNSSHQIISYAV